MSSDRADVVIVGAGVVGATIAYELAERGLNVTIVEREGIGRGSTGHGHGIISLVGKDFRPGPHFQLGLASAKLLPLLCERVIEDSGIDPMYHELPGLCFAVVEEEERIFREFMMREDVQDALDLRWLSVRECREIEPLLTEDAIGGVFHRHGQVDAYRLSLAAVAAVERRGGRLLSAAVCGLVRRGERILGVRHKAGTILCDHVVLAAGAWARDAAPWLEVPIPVRPLHGEVLHVRLPDTAVRSFVLTARHGPILPKKDGTLMVGSMGGVTMSGMDVDAKHVFDPYDATPPSFDERPTERGREEMIGRAVRVMPALADAELTAHLAGVRPLCADRMPLIGPVPGSDGVLLATGHGTKGIHLAAVTAAMVSDYVTQTRQTIGAISAAFLPSRFVERTPA